MAENLAAQLSPRPPLIQRTSARPAQVHHGFLGELRRWPQNKGRWVLGRGGPNKLFPQKNVLPEMAQEEKKKVKQNIFLAHIQNPSQMF